MSRDYGALRLWSTVLMFIGILGVIFVVIGVIFAVLGAASFWQVLAILLIGGTLGRTFRQLADRTWAGPEGSGRCRRVRPRSTARSPRRAAERGGASSPRLAGGEAEFGCPGPTSSCPYSP